MGVQGGSHIFGVEVVSHFLRVAGQSVSFVQVGKQILEPEGIGWQDSGGVAVQRVESVVQEVKQYPVEELPLKRRQESPVLQRLTMEQGAYLFWIEGTQAP